MVIPFSLALLCVETACGAIFSAREYPRARCPLCGSEAVSIAKEESKRVSTHPGNDRTQILGKEAA